MAVLDPEFISHLYPGTLKANVLKISVPSKGIQKLSSLGAYKNLARLDVSKNSLEDLQGIGNNSALTWLSAAHNMLNGLEDVLPLKKLQVLNAGHNALSGTMSLEGLSSLKALILNNNRITKLTGLADMPELNTLVISHNRVKKLGKMLTGCSALSKLSLAHNELTDFRSALKDCTRIFELKAAHNSLTGLPSSFSLCYRLRVLDLASNSIASTAAIVVLQELKFLRHLTLKGNPICSMEGYRDTIIEMLPNLESLDGKKIDGRTRTELKEKRSAQAMSHSELHSSGKPLKVPAGSPAVRHATEAEEDEDQEGGEAMAGSSDEELDGVVEPAELGLGPPRRDDGAAAAQAGSESFLEEVVGSGAQGGKASRSGIVEVIDKAAARKKGRKREKEPLPAPGRKAAAGRSALEALLAQEEASLSLRNEVGTAAVNAWEEQEGRGTEQRGTVSAWGLPGDGTAMAAGDGGSPRKGHRDRKDGGSARPPAGKQRPGGLGKRKAKGAYSPKHKKATKVGAVGSKHG
mmetsp:Transcript_33907/g.96059  ORF Transcript_33907/g.96059 Transcript_33907/m.96059 type:complete len:520 (-) Transcript_33907:151-1710(-)|eukprot:CAMPEP_0117657896 /NCGR_PEP_ID=MMETSP0804-20121206/5573_1 /TAXON_ID=1074897 /ORGANISM="Tetraselmis astigmatica, Strain CCMP880" /LENGTH=519 /DNA_ID=CAMNT_0005464377 /DNA_START=315 /DNA_END=1874 /DNA_ORIENTATION=-